MTIKQIIAVRTDLNMRKGKMCAQAAHASMEFLRLRANHWMTLKDGGVWCVGFDLSEIEWAWLTGDRTKIVVQGRDLGHLNELQSTCKLVGVISHLVVDQGRTDVEPGTTTALAIGPFDATVIDKITGELPLL